MYIISQKMNSATSSTEYYRESTSIISDRSISSSIAPRRIRAKRRLSDNADRLKRSRVAPKSTAEPMSSPIKKASNDWPVFEHPDGGLIQQSPYGNIRIIRDHKYNVEISTIDKSTTLESFSTGGAILSKQTASRSPGIVALSSPSSDAEGYMVEGYRHEHNRSYDHHKENILNINYSLYDHSTEDAHLSNDANGDLDMSL